LGNFPWGGGRAGIDSRQSPFGKGHRQPTPRFLLKLGPSKGPTGAGLGNPFGTAGPRPALKKTPGLGTTRRGAIPPENWAPTRALGEARGMGGPAEKQKFSVYPPGVNLHPLIFGQGAHRAALETIFEGREMTIKTNPCGAQPATAPNETRRFFILSRVKKRPRTMTRPRFDARWRARAITCRLAKQVEAGSTSCRDARPRKQLMRCRTSW